MFGAIALVFTVIIIVGVALHFLFVFLPMTIESERKWAKLDARWQRYNTAWEKWHKAGGMNSEAGRAVMPVYEDYEETGEDKPQR